MKIKNIIIFYPSFEAGGVEKIIENLTFFFTKKGLKVYLISTKTKNLKILKNIKNLNILTTKNEYLNILPNRISSSINCIGLLKNLLNKLDKKNTVVHSMQSNFIPIIISKLKGFKIVIRNSENPISSIKYAENKISSYIIFFLRFIFYNLSDKIITNSKGSSLSLRYFLFGLIKEK